MTYPHHIPTISLLYPCCILLYHQHQHQHQHHYIITLLHHHMTMTMTMTMTIIIIIIIIISPLFTTIVCQSPLYTYTPMKISPSSLVQRKNTSQLPCGGPALPPPRLWASFPSLIPAWRRSPTAQRSWAQRSKNWEGTRSPLADANFQDMGVSINGGTNNSWMVYKGKSY